MAFINFSGVELMDAAYVVSAIVLLPINSALNPILYSNVFDTIYDKVSQRVTNAIVWSRTSQQETKETSARDSRFRQVDTKF